MGHGLAGGQAQDRSVDGAAEQDREAIHCAAGLGEMLGERIQPVASRLIDKVHSALWNSFHSAFVRQRRVDFVRLSVASIRLQTFRSPPSLVGAVLDEAAAVAIEAAGLAWLLADAEAELTMSAIPAATVIVPKRILYTPQSMRCLYPTRPTLGRRRLSVCRKLRCVCRTARRLASMQAG
jgi:hypothetical protein